MRVVLASGSPRRKDILSSLIAEYEIITSEADEHCEGYPPERMVEILSSRKAQAVFEMDKSTEDILVIGADTVVSFQNQILGKPKNRMDAVAMISMLQGKTHMVSTGVTVIVRHGGFVDKQTFHENTKVSIFPMTEADIDTYVASGECDDKAGAYAIQGIFAKYIEGFDGDYYNVVGLPKDRLEKVLEKWNIK